MNNDILDNLSKPIRTKTLKVLEAKKEYNKYKVIDLNYFILILCCFILTTFLVKNYYYNIYNFFKNVEKIFSYIFDPNFRLSRSSVTTFTITIIWGIFALQIYRIRSFKKLRLKKIYNNFRTDLIDSLNTEFIDYDIDFKEHYYEAMAKAGIEVVFKQNYKKIKYY